jgi:Tol biopolymer transport system component
MLPVIAASLVVVGGAAPATAAGPGEVRLASHVAASATTTGSGTSFVATTSADGAYVAFSSTAGDLVAGQNDPNGGDDVFLLSRATGTVTLVSHAAGCSTTSGNSVSGFPAISADGAYVTFQSLATDLVPGQADGNGNVDVFLYERATGATSLVSHVPGSPTTTANDFSSSRGISADGAHVTFQSLATNLVAGQNDANGTTDVFLYARATGAVTLVSHTPGQPAQAANGSSTSAVLSADGGWVAFQSVATNLVTGQSDANSATDVFLYSRTTGNISLVSHIPAGAGTTGNGGSSSPAMSADGSYVAFESDATNLATGQSDPGATLDVFLFARSTGAVTLVSHAATSTTTTANGDSGAPSISADGSFVVFESDATNLVAGQSGASGTLDVFLYARATGTLSLVSHTPTSATTTGNGDSGAASISADGNYVVFESVASNLVTGQSDGNSTGDVFLYERSTGVVSLVSHNFASLTTTAAGRSAYPSVSANGNNVSFLSNANNLVANQVDANGGDDVFTYQRQASADGPSPPADFDGNGTTDFSVFRPSSGTWFVHNGAAAIWGTSGDIAVPGDYDGNGTTDFAVFRPSTGIWDVHNGASAQFGTSGDIPVPGDYDGNGTTDFAVYRPSTGTWFVRNGASAIWGTSGDIPVPGDYDGNGTTDFAVFRPSTGTWFVRNGASAQFGTSGDIALPLPDAIRRFFF